MREFIEKHVPKALLQFVGFGLVGGINTILSWLIVNGCFYFLGIHYQISNAIGFVITVFISFVLNRTFVFKKKEDDQGDGSVTNTSSGDVAEKPASWFAELLKVYVSYAFTGLFLTYILLLVEQEKLGIPLYIATVLNLIITIPINFLMNKFWAYKNRD